MHAKGTKNGRAILSEAQVLAIRREFKYTAASQKDLALQHGVSPSTIALIVKRKRWGHLE